MNDGFGVAGGLEEATSLDQFLANLVGIGEIAVVGNGQATEFEVGEQRLNIAEQRAAGSRIADVADGHVTFKL